MIYIVAFSSNPRQVVGTMTEDLHSFSVSPGRCQDSDLK